MDAPAGFRGIFRTDGRARGLYAEGAGVFRIVPAAVAAPADAADLQRLVHWAAETGTGLIPRGAGSGIPGGNVGSGVIVDLTRGFRATPVIDAERRTARAGAAVTYRDLNGAAAGYGLRLPPDPSSGAFCTLGGMVACDAAGAHTLKYGSIRAWTETLEFVTAEGETGRAGRAGRTGRTGGKADGRTGWTQAEVRLHDEVAPWLRQHQLPLETAVPGTRKNSSGYRLALFPDDGWIRHLLIGSEGTLAFITDVEVRLAPLPDDPSTLLVTLRALEDVAPAVRALAPHGPAAVELLDRTYLDFVRAAAHSRVPSDTEAVLLVEFEGTGRDAAAALAGIAASTMFAEDAAAAGKLWELRHLASPILAGLPDTMRSLQVVEDGCVPLDNLEAYIAGLRRVAADCGFEIVIFGHAADGHVHANLLADVTAQGLTARLERCLKETSALQIGLSGTTAGEHGDGRLRAPFLRDLFGDTYLAACRRVKAAFDPLGILNPGVKLPAEPAGAVLPADRLKVGPGAPALAPDVAHALREIERTAAWGVSRLDLLDTPS